MKKIHNIFTGLSFLIPFILYLLTMAPTVSLWDCGEFISTSVILGVPHPPGTPLYLIISNFFSQLPFLGDIGARVNFVSPIASALSVMFLYIIIVYMIEELIHNTTDSKNNNNSKLIAYCAGFIGALTFAVTDTQWFNAVESEVYALSTFFTAVIIWLILKWSRKFNQGNQLKYLILISYCIGLAIGIHLLNLLAIPFIGLIIFFNYISKTNHRMNLYNILALMVGVGLSFLVIYKGIIKGLPSFAYKTDSLFIPITFIGVTFIAVIICNIKLNKAFKIIQHIIIALFTFMILFITAHEL